MDWSKIILMLGLDSLYFINYFLKAKNIIFIQEFTIIFIKIHNFNTKKIIYIYIYIFIILLLLKREFVNLVVLSQAWKKLKWLEINVLPCGVTGLVNFFVILFNIRLIGWYIYIK